MAESRQPPSLFSKLFQISACFRQAFPKKALAVLWDFKGLQVSQAIKYRFQIFRPRRPSFAHIPDAPTPHSAARRGLSVPNRKSRFPNSRPRNCALKGPTRILASLKCSKSTLARILFFRNKIAALAPLASKIVHRVVVEPDPLIVGSSAAGHHHIFDAAHPSRQAAQGLSRLEAESERGTDVRAFCPPAVAAPRTREAFITAFAICRRWEANVVASSLVIPMRRVYLFAASNRNCRFIRVGI